MTNVECYLVSITYKVVDDKPIIHLIGRTKEGEKICIIDKNVQPYFYVELNEELPFEKVKPLFTSLSVKGKGLEYSVIDVQQVTKIKKNKETKLLKIIPNVPAGVPPLQKEIYTWEITKRSYEYDIRFTDKYLIDNELTPLTLIQAQGKFLSKKNQESFAKDCRVFEAEKVKQITPFQTFESPRVLAVDIETYNPEGKTIDIDRFPIIMLSLYGGRINSKGKKETFEKVITWKKFQIKDKEFAKKVEIVDDEAALIKRFGELTKEFDADILCGYNSDRFDLVYIKKRAQINKVSTKIGIDDSDIIIRGTTNILAKIIGISHIDVYKFIRRVFRFSMKTPIFTLDAVAQELLGKNKVEIDINQMYDAWDRADKRCEQFAYYNLVDSELTYELLVHGYSLLAEMTKVISLAPYDVSRSSMSQMVEGFILNKAAQENRLAPNKPSQKQLVGRRRGSFEGAFVVTPTPGFYADLAVFDFRSLYPTILVSHNISTDTVNCECCKDDAHIAPTKEKIWFCKKNKGFLSRIMEQLILHRKEIKQEIKKQGKTPLLNARSMALKYLCNSFYGYLGFSMSRWYTLEGSKAITAWARHYIKEAISKAESQGFEVVYGDTDSVFLKRGEKSKEEALQFVELVNKDLPEFMELEVDGFYPSAIFVGTKSGGGGAKKRYALLDEQDNVKIAGFETVRRNVSPVAKDVQREVLNILLKEKDEEKALKYVQKTVEDLKDHKVPIDRVTIFTKLTKKIEDYDAIGPHVAAAQRMIDKGDKVTPGTPIYYVVCKGTGRIRDKVKLPDEITEDDYDPDYYINNQVLPAVEKIFDALGHGKETLTKSKKQSSLGSFF